MNEWLHTGLKELGVSSGVVVLVHSSMKGLGPVEGGPQAVIDALLNAVGESGTVLFPTLTGSEADSPACPPRIDLAATPCWTGLIPETARTYPGAIRSVHPTHSITAISGDATKWASGHEHGNSPCDESSPYYRLMEEGGKILLLGGVTHDSNTSIHCVEELAEMPYHLQPEPTDGVVTMPTGEQVIVRNRLHLWQDYYSDRNWERDFLPASDPLRAADAERSVRIGRTESTLIDARIFRDVMVPILRQNPYFLLREPKAE